MFPCLEQSASGYLKFLNGFSSLSLVLTLFLSVFVLLMASLKLVRMGYVNVIILVKGKTLFFPMDRFLLFLMKETKVFYPPCTSQTDDSSQLLYREEISSAYLMTKFSFHKHYLPRRSYWYVRLFSNSLPAK